MAITYPLSLPSAAGVRGITLRAANVVAVAESPFTFRQQVIKHPGERWEASVTLPPMQRPDAEAWVAFLLALKGRAGTFLLGDPSSTGPRGALSSGTVQIRTEVAAGASALALKGLPASTTGALLPGDFLQLGAAGTASLHKVLLPVDADASGHGTAEVWPAARRTVPVDEVVVWHNPVGRFRLAGNLQEWQIDVARFYGISFDAVEAVA